jgi:hypothetical protein
MLHHSSKEPELSARQIGVVSDPGYRPVAGKIV